MVPTLKFLKKVTSDVAQKRSFAYNHGWVNQIEVDRFKKKQPANPNSNEQRYYRCM